MRPAANDLATERPPILRGLDLTVNAGEVHAIMGPNGSGKSTLGSTLMGSPEYEVTAGTIEFLGDDVTDWPTDERAKAGMFLAFQYPQEIAGVSVIQFLRQAQSARKGIDLSVLELRLATMDWMKRLGMDSSFVDRYLNEGFSGGEKKRNEIMQMAILEPELAILDETDSGLDIDALRVVARGIREVRVDRPSMGVVLITHYQRLLDEVTPDHIHILVDGRIVATGGMELAEQLERDGYDAFRPTATVPAASRRRGCRRRRVDRELSTMTLDVATIRKEFPILDREIDGAPIVYLDSGNTSQKPRQVIDAMSNFLEQSYAPINRSSYRLAGEATDAYEHGRQSVARFINAPNADEVVFTKNATESINLVAQTWGRANLKAGDVVVLTQMEHHANIVPWHMLAAERGIEIRWIPLTADGRLDTTDLGRLLDGAKVLSFTAMSNVLGTLPPVAELCARRPRRRGVDDRRRLPVRPAQPDRRPGLGRRLRRVLQPQDVRPVGHRDALGPHGAARRDAAVPRRRQHDRHRHVRGLHHRHRCRRSTKPARRPSPKRSGSARPSTSSRRSGWTPSASTRWSSPATRSTR